MGWVGQGKDSNKGVGRTGKGNGQNGLIVDSVETPCKVPGEGWFERRLEGSPRTRLSISCLSI